MRSLTTDSLKASKPQGPLPRMLTVDATAEQLGVSTKTVRRWIDEAKLPHHRFGRQLRVSEPDLIRFIERHRQA